MLDISFSHDYAVDSNTMFFKLSDSSLRLHCLSPHICFASTEFLRYRGTSREGKTRWR